MEEGGAEELVVVGMGVAGVVFVGMAAAGLTLYFLKNNQEYSLNKCVGQAILTARVLGLRCVWWW